MKISNASKKVLASALSAAMVVAFAPTVALAAPKANDVAHVKLVVQTGPNSEAGTGDSALALDQNVVLDSNKQVKAGDVDLANAANYKYYGQAISGWFYDANNDGKYTTGDESGDQEVSKSATALNAFVPADSFDAASNNVITLVAEYNGLATVATDGYADTTEAAKTAAFKAAVAAGIYDVKVTKDGTEVFSKTGVTTTDAEGLTFVTTDDSAKVGTVSAAVAASEGKDAEPAKAFIAEDSYGAGKYVVTYTVATGDAKGYTASAEFTLHKVTLAPADARSMFDGTPTTEYYVADKATLGSATYNKIAAVKTKRSDNGADVKSTGWVDAAGDAISADTKVTADVTFTSVYADAKVNKVQANLASKTMTFTASNLDDVNETADATTGVKEYKAEISGPGVDMALTGKQTSSKAMSIELTFGAAATTSNGKIASSVSTSAAPQAGTYTFKLTQVNHDGTSVEVGSKSIELVKVSYDLGEGKVVESNKDVTADKLKTLPSVAVKGGTLDNAYTEGTKASTMPTVTMPAGSLNTLKEWGVSGLTKDDKVATKIDAALSSWNGYKVTGDVVVKAVYEQTLVAAPTATVDGTTLTIATAEGTKAYYKVGDASGWTLYTAPVTLKSTDSKVTVVAYKGSTASSEAKYTKKEAKNASSYVSAKAAIASLTNFSTPATYLANIDGYKTAVAAADATFTGWNTDEGWKKVEYTAIATVMGSYAGVADAAIDEYVAGVAQKDGSVKKLDAAKAAEYKANIAAVEAAWLTNNAETDTAKQAEIKIGNTTVVAKGSTTLANYTDAITTYVNGAISAATKYAKADVDAAKAASDALKAAKTTDELKAALEAYSKLTDTQKSLVAAADVQAANEALNAAELTEAQDEAAIAAVKGKTVKAKAKKKTTASLKVVTSKSGAKSTFKKTSGNKKIKIAKGGKITVAKGLKAGKKYTARVKATVGTQTKTIKVIVKVSK